MNKLHHGVIAQYAHHLEIVAIIRFFDDLFGGFLSGLLARPVQCFIAMGGLRNMARCQCGEWSGTPCEWSGPDAALVTVEWIPEWLRAAYVGEPVPSGTAERLRLAPRCADVMCELDATAHAVGAA